MNEDLATTADLDPDPSTGPDAPAPLRVVGPSERPGAEPLLNLTQEFPELLEQVLRTRFIARVEPVARHHDLGYHVPVADLVPPAVTMEHEFRGANAELALVRGSGWSALLYASRNGFPSWVELTATTSAIADAALEAIVERAPAQHVDDTTVPMELWRSSHGQPVSATRRIDAPAWSDVEWLYPPPVAQQLAELVAMTGPPEASGKLFLFHGPPGTGKTTFLRALARGWEPWCDVHYVMDPEQFFGDPSYMLNTVLDEEDDNPFEPWTRRPRQAVRLIVIEDVEAMVRGRGLYGGEQMARLLNLADGMPGQGLRFLLAMTSNEPPDALHPAVTRPGRCAARVELRAFTPREATAWLGERVTEDSTLAQLLERRGDLHQLRTDTGEPASTGQYL